MNTPHRTIRIAWAWPLALFALAMGLLLWPVFTTGRVARAVMDLGHAPLFAVLAGTCCWSLRRTNGSRFGGLWVWIGLAGFAVASETLQGWVGRQSSGWDALANLLGATAGVLWMETSWEGLRLWAVRGLALVLFLGAIARPLWILADAAIQRWQFPMLASFESPLELSRWSLQGSQIQRVRSHATEGHWALQVDLGRGLYPGLAIPEVPPDWTAYQGFAFDVTLESPDSLSLIVKLTDETHNWESDDRFHYHTKLQSGLNRIQIPMREIQQAPNGRFLDLSRMRMLQFFTVSPQTPARIYLDNIRLIPSQPAEDAVMREGTGSGVGASGRD